MYSTNIPINQELATLRMLFNTSRETELVTLPESNNVSREAKTVYTI